MAETKMLEILMGIQADMQDVKNNQEKTNQNIEGMYKEMTKKFEEFDIQIKEMDVKLADLRKNFIGKFAEVEVEAAGNVEQPRGGKIQRTGLSSRRAASAEGRQPRTQVVLVGFPTELMQPTLQRAAESVRQSIRHSGSPPKIKVLDFSRKAIFVFQSEAQAQSFVERADAHDFPFTCPISKAQVALRMKLHIPAEDRTHAKTVGALQNQITKVRQGLDLGSNGARGDVFIRNGDVGAKLFKVQEEMDNGRHKIEAHFNDLQKIGIDAETARNIIAATHA